MLVYYCSLLFFSGISVTWGLFFIFWVIVCSASFSMVIFVCKYSVIWGRISNFWKAEMSVSQCASLRFSSKLGSSDLNVPLCQIWIVLKFGILKGILLGCGRYEKWIRLQQFHIIFSYQKDLPTLFLWQCDDVA